MIKKPVLLFLILSLSLTAAVNVKLQDSSRKNYSLRGLVKGDCVVLLYQHKDAAQESIEHYEAIRKVLKEDVQLLRLSDISSVPGLIQRLIMSSLEKEELPFYLITDKDESKKLESEKDSIEILLFNVELEKVKSRRFEYSDSEYSGDEFIKKAEKQIKEWNL